MRCSIFIASFALFLFLVVIQPSASTPTRDDGLTRRARIRFNGEKCRKSVQCHSENCERARCRSKHANGHICYKNANCKSGYCKNRSVCAPISLPDNNPPNTNTSSPLPSSNSTTSNNDTSSAPIDSGSGSLPINVTIPDSGNSGNGNSTNDGSDDGDDGGVAIVGSGAPSGPALTGFAYVLQLVKGINGIYALDPVLAAPIIQAKLSSQLAVLNAQKAQLQNQVDQLRAVNAIDEVIDAALARLKTASDQFDAVLDTLTDTIKDRADTLSSLGFRA